MSDAKELLSKALEKRRLLTTLAEDKGFLFLNSILQEQVDQLQNEILFSPLSGVDSAWKQEYKKGELKGKLSWHEALQTAIESLDVTINHFQDNLDASDDERATDGNRSP